MEVQVRIGKGSKCSWAYKAILHSRSISHRTKVQLYTTVIRPVVTYGCETWALTKGLTRKLEVFERTILRKIFGPIRDEDGEWRMRHNVDLMRLARIPPISNFIRAQRLRWAGHVARSAEDGLLRRVLMETPEGRRPPGRPRQRWLDCVKADVAMLGEDPEMWMALAEDRRRWRLLVLAAMDHQGLEPME